MARARSSKKQIERITAYEAMMDEALALLASEPRSQRLAELADRLDAYYRSPQWKKDYAADEAGLLPQGLKRGVLSEDGLYLLLERCAEERQTESNCPDAAL